MGQGQSTDDGKGTVLDRVLAEYMRQVDRGEPVDREALIAANPTLESELRAYFSQASAVRKLTGDLTVDFAGPVSPPSAAEFQGGARIGDYRIVRKLGAGGMGAVYEADQLSSGRRVAIKVIKDTNPTETLRRRFLKEGRLAAAISHPNSVYVYGTEELDGKLAIVMELAGGGTLADKIAVEGPLPISKAVDAVLEIIDGLEAALAQNVVHRDIKPSNCFVAEDGRIQIGDFGLSVSSTVDATTMLTRTGEFAIGTPQFAPPEQLRGQPLDHRSDIYSVGATLYYLLSGKPPFSGNQLFEVITNVIDGNLDPITKTRRDVPERLQRVISKCLEKRPADRYQSYQDLRAALRPFSGRVQKSASPGLRVLAYIIDSASIENVALPLLLSAWFVDWTTLSIDRGSWAVASKALEDDKTFSGVYSNVTYLFPILYFALCEWLYGASLGKWLLGIKVINVNGQRLSFGQALMRAAIFEFICWVAPTLIGPANTPGVDASDKEMLIYAGLTIGFTALCFVTARRSNGWRGLHEFLTRTRVVQDYRITDSINALPAVGRTEA
jgi:serine/threonine protein kinase